MRRIARTHCSTLTGMTREFGYRLLADEARDEGSEAMSDRTAWRIASANGWWSVFGKKRSKNGKKPGPAVHDDLCVVIDEHGRERHQFTASRPNQLWLTDITEHRTSEGRLLFSRSRTRSAVGSWATRSTRE